MVASQKRTAPHIAVLVGACLLAFAPTVRHGFLIWDDRAFIADNPLIAQPSAANLVRLWTTPLYDLYAPLTYTLWAGLSAVFGTQPWAFHLTNVVLHVLAACVVYAVLRRLLADHDPTAALAGALVFAIHPLQTEAIAWASATKDLLSALCSVIAIHHYLLFREHARRRFYVGAFVAFACALLAKPAAVYVPLVVLILERTLYRRDWTSTLRALTPWFVAALAITLFTMRMQRAGRYLHYIAPVWLRPVIALDSLTFYLGKLVLPLNLIAEYTRSSQSIVSSGALAYTWIPSAAVLAAAWVLRRKHAWLATAIAVFYATLLPVLGLVPFAFQWYSNVADHYVYPAMLGPAIGFAFLYPRLGSVARHLVIPLTVATLLPLSFVQASYWKDDATLFSRILAVNPRSVMAHDNLGQILEQQGRLEEALVHYRAAAEDSLDGKVNVGNVLAKQGKYDEVIAHYTAALGRLSYLEQHTAAAAYMHNNLGVAYMRKNMLNEAAREFELAARTAPPYTQPYLNLGSILMSVGRYDDAAQVFRRGLAANPTDEALRAQLAAALSRSGG